MRSTRSLLIGYFLGLLAVGLGVVAILADQVVIEALEKHESAAIDALVIRTEERIKNERDRFDRELLTHSRLIGRVARTEYLPQSDVDNRNFIKLIAQPYFAGFGPMHGLWATTWHSGITPPWRTPGPGTNPPSLFRSLMRSYLSNLQLDGLFLKPIDDEDRMTDYVQINAPFNSIRRSGNLIASGYTLPFDRRLFDNVLEDWRHDNIMLPNGQMGRRAVFKTPLPLLAFGRFSSSSQRGGTRDNPAPPQTDPLQLIYIHVARPTAELDRQIAQYRAIAERERQSLKDETRLSVHWIRLTLGVTGSLTFLAGLFGSSWLVRRGLKPLNRLSDAVSRVSERDFNLAVNRNELSIELQPIHQRITETLEQLKSAFDREKQSVADISHELRTPVASLLATLDVALRKPRTNEQYHQTLIDCRGITKQLGQLVEKVMTLAYLDAGQSSISTCPVDAGELANDCVSVIRPLATAHGLTLELHSQGPLNIETDPDKLREVLTNLLHNAVEYNRPGGRIELNVVPEKSGIRFDVKDTGIGMTGEVREKIFERFYRADSSRTATGVHAGLGLAIVKEYLERLGGTIDVESEPDVGTTFSFTLPAA